MSKERNYIFDALKFVCAFFVVTFHAHPSYREIIKPFLRCAVPLFFMISGYFLYTNEKFGERLLKSIKKIFKIFFFVLILFSVLFPLTLKCGLEQPLKWIDLPEFILTNDVPIAYHLWYLPAFIYVLAITYLVDKWGKLRWMFPLSLIVFCIYLLGAYSSMLIFGYKVPAPVWRNFLFVGIPFFSIGMYLKQHETYLREKANLKLYLLGGISILMSYAEWEMTSLYGAYFPYYLGTILLTITIFVFCMTHSLKIQNTIAKLGYEYSLLIYLLHPIIIYPFKYYEKYVSNGVAITLYHYTSPVIVTLLTIGLIYLLKKFFRGL